mgnify:FL=1
MAGIGKYKGKGEFKMKGFSGFGNENAPTKDIGTHQYPQPEDHDIDSLHSADNPAAGTGQFGGKQNEYIMNYSGNWVDRNKDKNKTREFIKHYKTHVDPSYDPWKQMKEQASSDKAYTDAAEAEALGLGNEPLGNVDLG